MVPVVVTLILLITSFEINRNDGSLKDRKNRQGMLSRTKEILFCKLNTDKYFLKFVEDFKSIYSRIIGNIRELQNDLVSNFLSSFML